MKTKIFTCCFFLVNFILSINLSAQLSTNELPVSSLKKGILEVSREYPDNMKKVIYLPIPMEDIVAQDIIDDANGVPPRFGYPIPVNFDLNNSGKWTILPNGDRLWQLWIKSPGANTINLLYDKFWIPEGTKLYIYTPDNKQHIGAFTSLNNKGDSIDLKGFATSLLHGEEIIIEYFIPANITFEGIISISKVIHGYRFLDLLDLSTKSFGSAGSCISNINCPAGANWQKEKRAVAKIVIDGSRLCTGSLINNTSHDAQPYFLTANHCVNGNGLNYDAAGNADLSGFLFWWDYEAPSCANPTRQPSYFTTSGATLVANNSTSDFALFRLSEDPKNLIARGYYPFYLAWKTTNPTSGGATIHHPRGDIKKISTYSQTPASNGNYWRINSSSSAQFITEPGSSGSPLLNGSAVVGQLQGGTTACDNLTGSDNFGKFGISWTGNGSSDRRRRLKDWLDPTGSNQSSITSYPPQNIGQIYGPSSLNTNETGVYYLNIPNGEVQWTTSPGLQVISGQNTPRVTIKATGGYGPIRINANFWGQYAHRDIDVNYKSARTITGPSTGRAGQTVYYRAEPMYEDGTYTWRVTNSNAFVAGTSKYDAQVVLINAGNVTLECRYAAPGGTPQTVPAMKVITIQNSYSVSAKDGQVTITPVVSSKKMNQTLRYVLIHQISGQILDKGNMNAQGGILNYPNMQKGVYVLKLESDDGLSETFKIAL